MEVGRQRSEGRTEASVLKAGALDSDTTVLLMAVRVDRDDEAVADFGIGADRECGRCGRRGPYGATWADGLDPAVEHRTSTDAQDFHRAG
jgi:hypothetical protein